MRIYEWVKESILVKELLKVYKSFKNNIFSLFALKTRNAYSWSWLSCCILMKTSLLYFEKLLKRICLISDETQLEADYRQTKWFRVKY